jgi:cell division protease FtsH
VAEELVFGRDRVTTGAASDIQQATALARRYVSQWGLSEAIGPVLVGDNEQELFLGRELQTRREVSERTAQLVDSEVSRVIKEAYARATEVLQEHMELLHTVANALLDRETLTGEEVMALARGETLPPRPVSPPPSAPLLTTPVMHPKPSKPPLFGGPEVAPA